MRVILCREFGSPDVLTVEERPDPEPGMGEVLVRQEAWGVNYVDALMVAGGYQLKPDLPFVPGLEAAGTVVETGFGSSYFEPGDRVVVSHRPGAFAELAAVTFDRVRAAPPELDMTEAAVFRSAYHTALHALLQRGRLAPGESVLVLGAAGGVGMAAVHCAKRLGAQVIAAAAGEEKLAALRRQGADVVIDYRDGFRAAVLAATGGRGADVVYDPVGGDAFDEAMRSTAWGGRILAIGFTSGRRPVAKVNHILIKGIEVIGVRAGEAGRRNPNLPEETWRYLTRWVSEDGLRPHIGHRIPFSRAAEALQLVLDRKVIGKAVLVPDG